MDITSRHVRSSPHVTSARPLCRLGVGSIGAMTRYDYSCRCTLTHMMHTVRAKHRWSRGRSVLLASALALTGVAIGCKHGETGSATSGIEECERNGGNSIRCMEALSH